MTRFEIKNEFDISDLIDHCIELNNKGINFQIIQNGPNIIVKEVKKP